MFRNNLSKHVKIREIIKYTNKRISKYFLKISHQIVLMTKGVERLMAFNKTCIDNSNKNLANYNIEFVAISCLETNKK